MRNWLLAGALVALTGCAPTYVWKSTPPEQKVSTELYDAGISPVCTQRGCNAFILRLRNKSNANIEIDWNKTLYVTENRTSGGFMFEGILYSQRNNPKPPDVIFPNYFIVRPILPNDLAEFHSGEYGGWVNTPMSVGENGVYLSLLVDGREESRKLTVDLSATRAH